MKRRMRSAGNGDLLAQVKTMSPAEKAQLLELLGVPAQGRQAQPIRADVHRIAQYHRERFLPKVHNLDYLYGPPERPSLQELDAYNAAQARDQLRFRRENGGKRAMR